MFTVLIVEDELLVRMGIASSVPWMQLDMKVVAEAEDGQGGWEAYEQYRPDIVIMDIRMPKLSGLELLRKIRAVDRQCAVILVTNVENTPTLDAAHELGIVDVLIKAAMKRDDITAAVRKARMSLPGDRLLREDAGGGEPLWREFLCNAQVSPEAFHERCAKAGIRLMLPSGFALMHICLSKRLSHRLSASLVSLMTHRLNITGGLDIVEIPGGAVALAKDSFDVEYIERVLRELEWYVHSNFHERLRFVLQSGPLSLEQLREDIAQAIRYAQQDTLFDYPVLQLDAGGLPVLPGLKRAVDALRRCAPLAGASDALPQCAGTIEALPALFRANPEGGMERGRWALGQLGAAMECSGMHMLAEALERAATAYAQQARASMRPEILAAIDYMEAHITDELSIRAVSEITGYHPSYFSNLFKHETGVSYSDYLTNMRIGRAQKLLRETGASLQEIARLCGFSDLSYFSARFKSKVGVSPSKWRGRA